MNGDCSVPSPAFSAYSASHSPRVPNELWALREHQDQDLDTLPAAETR